jgi:hypothetical protein
MAARLKALALAAWMMSGYACLGLIWCIVLRVCAAKLLPRLAYFTAGKRIGNDAPCGKPECDFSQVWPAGLLARAHQYATIYDPAAFWTARRALVFAGAGRVDWIYPPPMLLPAMLVSHLPFEWGFAAWTAVMTLGALAILRWSGVSWPVAVIGMCSPAALWNLELGQVGTLMGALLLGSLLMAPRAPLRAGIPAGLLVLKPQFGLLLPAVFGARRAYPAIIAAAMTAALCIILTLALLQGGAWAAYARSGLPAAGAILRAPFALGYQQFGVPVFWMLRSFGAGTGVSYAAQAAVSAACLAAAWRLWRHDRLAPVPRAAITLCLALLATPYGFTYDMVAYSIALAMLAEARGWRIDPLDALLWLWPALCPVIVMRTGLLLTPLVVAIAAGRMFGRATPVPRDYARVTS